jgi:hypothetical protein
LKIASLFAKVYVGVSVAALIIRAELRGVPKAGTEKAVADPARMTMVAAENFMLLV